MTDLIDRLALDLEFTKLRFNKDGTLRHWGDRPEWFLCGQEVEELINSAQSVDAAPVVRCKDCNKYQDVHQWCKLHELEMQPMDFCSYGERKDAVD